MSAETKGKNVFVFVVCGTADHTDALHYSLQALKKFSKAEIVVLTDTSRNEEKINHSAVIDIKTPEHFNHHQASIFLKTGLHKFLPSGNNYCYLDTDVVALNHKVDEIFREMVAPISFAKDHCLMDRFSPTAIKCGCAEQYGKWSEELKYVLFNYKDKPRKPENELKKKVLLKKFEEIKKDKLKYAIMAIQFKLTRSVYKLDEDNYYDKNKFLWHDRNGDPIIYEKDVEDPVNIIENTTPYRNNRSNTSEWTINGKNVFDSRCNHLKEQIEKTFSIAISEPEWQHWNGGVFLFNENSHPFLDAWHKKTLKIFELPEWKVRDQGTLIATVWQMGLQRHPTINPVFNLIADYHQRSLKHLGHLHFKYEGEKKIIEPNFIHIYHHWGNKSWDVWNEVEKKCDLVLPSEPAVINSLWIGDTLSALELLTIQSYIVNGHTFKLWLYEELQTPLPKGVLVQDASTIIPRENVFSYTKKNKYGHGKGSYAGFSDIFRYKLLYEKGGWWTDMDITCLKPYQFNRPYFFRSHHELPVVGNVLKCPPKSKLMKLCYEEALKSVTAENTDWHKPIEILNKNIAVLDLGSYIERQVSNYDRWDETATYLMHNRSIPENWFFIHWQNEEWRSRKISKQKFSVNSTFAQLLKKYSVS